MIRRRLARGLPALLLVGLLSAWPLMAAAAPASEAADTGDLPATAQALPPTTTAISGTLAPRTDVDMYRIYIANPAAFSAEVTTLGDTMLALFDASGKGVYMNDDKSGFEAPARLPTNHALGPQSAGVYYLAISVWNNAASSGGGLIFPAISTANNNLVHGPTGPGGGAAISGWNGDAYTGYPDSTAYTINLTGVGYQVCALYDQSKSHKSGSTVPIKLQLCDATGANVSAAEIVVSATGLTKQDNTASGVEDAGSANSPDDNFRYDAALGGYIYNLSTKGLTTGTWTLDFTVDGVSLGSYVVKFDVK